jgi:hypothetical protein
MPELTLDAQHVYRWDDRILPSVSAILREWYKIDHWPTCYFNPRTGQTVRADVFENAGDRGTEHTGF